MALKAHTCLSLFVAAAAMLTIVVICASYSQIIELFPSGGGGYLVASKLLSPTAGVVSGCALDRRLCADHRHQRGKRHGCAVQFAAAGMVLLAANKMEFAVGRRHLSHGAESARREGIGAAAGCRCFSCSSSPSPSRSFMASPRTLADLPGIARGRDRGRARRPRPKSACAGLIVVMLRAYSLGAGTYTGIEAVSNGLAVAARTARADRQTHDGLHGQLAVVRGRRIAADLPALSRHAGGGQNAERRSAGANDRRLAGVARKRFCDRGAGRRRRRCCSSPRKPAFSAGRACWPTWRWTAGCRRASPR